MSPDLNPKLHVLAIDDHVVVLEGYHYMFQNLDQDHGELKFVKAKDCKTGYKVISANRDQPFDIALIDYSIPQYEDQQLYTGEDLAMLVRETMPECKIILMTMHKEIDIISSILNKIDPEGFINKSDCSTEELSKAFKEVLDGKVFYSKAISNYLHRRERVWCLKM